jgi:dTDP-N-acetylfucosamine:lipid II N-acetylfucosaminyltransferase
LSKKILHIATDEKFIDNAFKQFREIDVCNEFYVVLNRGVKSPNFVKETTDVNVVNISKSTFKNLQKKIKEADLVVMYGLQFFNSGLILQTEGNYLWMFLGGEIYDNEYGLYSKILGDKSQKIRLKKHRYSFVKNVIKPLARFLFYGHFSHKKTIIKAAKKVNFVGVAFQEEFNILKENNFLHPDAQLFKFSFYTIEIIISNYQDVQVTGDNIMIGNSSSETNNHLELFDLLEKINLDNKKIYVPLSYGSKEYASIIKEIGRKKFGSNFTPLDTFMPLDEYNKLLQSCGVVIMNHHRQQAFGNIVASLWMGAKVFLDDRNTIYKYLKRIGVNVFSVQHELNQDQINNALSASDVNKNREILFKELNKQKLVNDLYLQIDELLQ